MKAPPVLALAHDGGEIDAGGRGSALDVVQEPPGVLGVARRAADFGIQSGPVGIEQSHEDLTDIFAENRG